MASGAGASGAPAEEGGAGGSRRRGDFICGVVEGFYGRPWTTEQRKDLFQKLNKWGMDTYVYAPKDDYKHRAYWRELYTVEEAEHLTSLISAAKARGVAFCYALSPGLDITYSSQKEITTLKRKLEQVSQFGCTSFALLFDDIEPEMSEADKQIFQSFAHAQVSVTNEVHQHLGCPRFLLCPTQYCSTRAVPTVNNSEYLNTLGSKLSREIDIMWTGEKVISKILTAECIQEITAVLRRPPVIWDNLHANDYDQKRVFLGPYIGRSPELIPLLRGVLTNPNCEYNANLIPIWTLAHWANCSFDAPAGLEAVSWDIKLEREGEQGVCEDEAPLTLSKHVYHHRQALRHAINEWLPEMSIVKTSTGPMTKPQPVVNVAPVPIIPIMPSVNTCMSLITPTCNTNTTSTCSMSTIPTVNTSQLQALAEVCTARAEAPLLAAPTEVQMETFNPISNPIMNSLVSATKVVMNDSIPNPIIPMASSNMSIPTEIPVSTLPVPIMGLKNLDTDNGEKKYDDQAMSDKDKPSGEPDESFSTSVLESASFTEQLCNDAKDKERLNGCMSLGDSPLMMSPCRVSIPEVCMEGETLSLSHGDASVQDPDIVMTDRCSENGSMMVEPSSSPVGSDMMVEPLDGTSDDGHLEPPADPNAITAEDLLLLCDLFYLPFEHGSRGLRLLHDFNWLVTRAASTLPAQQKDAKPEVCEWHRRRCRFAWWCSRSRRLARRLHLVPNRELHHELQPYVWDLCAVLALLEGFVRWLELGKFPPTVAANLQGAYTWFSKGWREAFESGAQEPWVFRGGLTADLRRLLPVECGSAELLRTPVPLTAPLNIRPYRFMDEQRLCDICHKTCRDGSDCTELFPEDLQTLPADRLVSPFLTLTPEFCMVIEDDTDCEEDLSASEEKLNGSDKPIRPELVGYACAALSSKEFYSMQEVAWIPEMCKKYPAELCEREGLSQAAKDCVRHFHNLTYTVPEEVFKQHPALLTCCVLPTCREPQAPARLVTCLLAALRANGAFGVHVCINNTDHFLHQFYTKLGFLELQQDSANGRTYLGRTF